MRLLTARKSNLYQNRKDYLIGRRIEIGRWMRFGTARLSMCLQRLAAGAADWIQVADLIANGGQLLGTMRTVAATLFRAHPLSQGQAMTKSFRTVRTMSLAILLCAICGATSSKLHAAGVTIITHGWAPVPDEEEWVTEMASAVQRRADASGTESMIIKMYVSADLSLSPVSVKSRVAGTDNLTDAATGEVIVIVNWSQVANHLRQRPSVVGHVGFRTQDVAAHVASELLDNDIVNGISRPLAELPIHLIGHSRGGSLMCALARDLGERGIWVDQVTTIDPHPLAIPDLGVVVTPPYALPDNSLNVWQNVVFADNYWRKDPVVIGWNLLDFLDFNGHPVPNSHSVKLGDTVMATGAYGGAHRNMHLWYHGTVDTSSEASADGRTPEDSWYIGEHDGARTETGYHFSRIAGGTRSNQAPDGLSQKFEGTAEREPLPSTVGSQWPNVMITSVQDGQVTSGDEINASIVYMDTDGSGSIVAYLDTDQNPYNEGQIYLVEDSYNEGTPNEPQPWPASLSSAGAPFGTNYLYVRITDGTARTRYFYWGEPIEIIPLGVTIAASPSGQGLEFSVDGQVLNASQTFEWEDGSSHILSVTSPQLGTDGIEYFFKNWSDGNTSATRSIMITGDASYTAIFERQSAVEITITRPSSGDVWTTPSSRVYLHGLASPEATQVTWHNGRNNDSGTADGTTAWESGRISLEEGDNFIVVTAHGANGRTGTDAITIAYNTSTKDINISAIKKTFILSGSPYRAVGPTDPDIGFSPHPDNQNIRGLVHYDLADLPQGSVINSARVGMRLKDSNPVDAGLMRVTAFRILDSWEQDTVKWRYDVIYTSADSESQDIGTTRRDWYYWDIQRIVAVWWNAASENHGLMFISDKENGTATNIRGFENPLLKINYIPESEAPDVAITGPTSNPSFAFTNEIPVIQISGTSSDNDIVASVDWNNITTGGSGIASGTSAWTATLPLVEGYNTVYVTARDREGNTTTDTITIWHAKPDFTPPTIPQLVRAVSLSQGSARVVWEPSHDVGGLGVKEYQVYTNGVLRALTPFLLFEDSLLAPNAAYCYTVKAVDNADNVSPASSPACISTVLPDSPVMSTPELVSDTELDFLLTASTGYVYTLECSTNLIDWQDIATVIGTNATITLHTTNAPSVPQRFYRLRFGASGSVVSDPLWTTVQNLLQARELHTATLLDNGLILIAGGDISSTDYVSTDTCELFDPISHTITPAASLNVPRMFHDAVKLSDGRVLVVGGQTVAGSYLSSCEIYDPVQNTWTLKASLNDPAGTGALVLLENGKVLRVGGAFKTSCELYDVNDDAWTYTGAISAARNIYNAWTRLADGRVLVAGGYGFNSTVEVYNPESGSWTNVGSMGRRVSVAEVEQLDDGRVFIMGGEYWSGSHTRYADVTIYDPTTDILSVGPSMPGPHSNFETLKTSTGNLLAMSGWSTNSTITPQCDLFVADLDAWVNAPQLVRPRVGFRAIYTGGRAFVFGGVSKLPEEPTTQLADAIEMLEVDALSTSTP